MEASVSKYCTRCGTTAPPVSRGANAGTVVAGLASAAVASWLMRKQRTWWLPLALAAPSALALVVDRTERCPACHADAMIPLDTPVARERLAAAREPEGAPPRS